MQQPSKQRGMGMLGWITVVSFIGMAATVGMKIAPLYLNEMAVKRIVTSIAEDPAYAKQSVRDIRRTLGKRWDVDNVTTFDYREIKILKTKEGRALKYDYEARIDLFTDIFLVMRFHGLHVMRGSASS